jgi:hypothetical protein
MSYAEELWDGFTPVSNKAQDAKAFMEKVTLSLGKQIPHPLSPSVPHTDVFLSLSSFLSSVMLTWRWQVALWFHKRANYEREYAKKLQALAKWPEADMGTVQVLSLSPSISFSLSLSLSPLSLLSFTISFILSHTESLIIAGGMGFLALTNRPGALSLSLFLSLSLSHPLSLLPQLSFSSIRPVPCSLNFHSFFPSLPLSPSPSLSSHSVMCSLLSVSLRCVRMC